MTNNLKRYNPYPGPRPFEIGEQEIFFGRERETRELLSLIISHKVVLLYAQSGAGKSSLLNAGVIPLLKKEGFDVLPIARVRGFEMEGINLKEIPDIYSFNTLMGWVEDKTDLTSLASISVTTFLRERKNLTDEDGMPLPMVVVFDQFEELFTSYPEHWKEREEFFRQIADALEAKDIMLRILFIIREDYLAKLDSYTHLLPERLRTRYHLERFRQQAACMAVEKPLLNIGCSFTEMVAANLVQQLLIIRSESNTGETIETIGEYVEPVQLQVICQNLWLNLPEDVTIITPEHLHAFGDVNKALTDFYIRIIEIVKKQTNIKEEELRNWFNTELITPVGTRGTVFRGHEYTGKIPNSAVDILEDHHIIRAEMRAGAHWYELTHDRLIEPIRKSNETWFLHQQEEEQKRQVDIERQLAEKQKHRAEEQTRKAKILRKMAAGLVLMVLLVSGAGAYAFYQQQQAESEREKAEVARLDEIKARKAEEREREKAEKAMLNEMKARKAEEGEREKAEKAMLNEMKARKAEEREREKAETMKVHEEKARKIAERERKKAEESEKKAINAGQRAKEQANIALAQKLIIQSESIRKQRPNLLPLSVLLAVESLERLPLSLKQELTQILRDGLSLLPYPIASMTAHSAPINAVAFSPNGEYIATASKDNTALIWKTTTGQKAAHIKHMDNVSAVAFSPNGKYLATASWDNTACIWDVASGKKITSMKHQGHVYSVAFNHDSMYLATAGEDNTARVWKVDTGQEVTRAKHTDRVFTAAFSPNGKYLVTVSEDNIARIWNVDNGKEITLLRHKSNISVAIFSPDGRYLATGSWDNTARLWNVTTAREITRITHKSDVSALAFSRDGTYLATASWDNTVRIYETASGHEIARMSHNDYVSDVAFSPNGKYIATASWDKTARIWEWKTNTPREVTRIAYHNYVSNVAFSMNGRYLVTVSSNNVQVWDADISGRNDKLWSAQPDELIAEACSRLTSNLTKEEWKQYLHDEPYRETNKIAQSR